MSLRHVSLLTSNCSTRTLFTSLTAEPHRIRRQRFSRYYTQSFLTNTPHVQKMISLHIGRLMSSIELAMKREPTIDALALSESFGLDIFTTLVYGLPSSTDCLSNNEVFRNWVDMWYDAHLGNADFWLSELPVLQSLLAKIGLDPVPRRDRNGRARFEEWGLGRVVAAEEDFKNGSSLSKDMPSIFTMMRANLLAAQQEKVGVSMSSDDPQLLEIAAELLDHFGEIVQP